MACQFSENIQRFFIVETAKTWKLRRLESEDGPAVRKLMQTKSMDHGYPEKWFEKKYLDNPFGEAVGCVADSRDGLAGQYVVFPVAIRFRREEIRACQSGDTITHPEFRRQGIFSKLAKETYRIARKEDIACVFGYPGGLSIHGFFNKLGWQEIVEVENYVIVFNPFKLLYMNLFKDKKVRDNGVKLFEGAVGLFWRQVVKRATKRCYEAGVAFQRIYAFDEGVEQVCRNLCDEYEFIVTRDAEYLNWKYFFNPFTNAGSEYLVYRIEEAGKTLGYAVYEIIDGVGRLLDYMIGLHAPKLFRLVIDHAIQTFFKKNCLIFSIHMHKENPYFGILKKMLFIPRKREDMVLGMLDFRKKNQFDNLDLSRWHIVPGDIDTY